MLTDRALAAAVAAAYHAGMRAMILPLLLALVLPACQTLGERSDQRKLNQTLDSYAAATRWQPLEALYGFLQPELQPAAPPAGLDNLRVTGYEVSAAPRLLDDDKAAQTVVIEYVHLDRQVVRRLVDSQLWARDKSGRWLRANPIPSFK